MGAEPATWRKPAGHVTPGVTSQLTSGPASTTPTGPRRAGGGRGASMAAAGCSGGEDSGSAGSALVTKTAELAFLQLGEVWLYGQQTRIYKGFPQMIGQTAYATRPHLSCRLQLTTAE